MSVLHKIHTIAHDKYLRKEYVEFVVKTEDIVARFYPLMEENTCEGTCDLIASCGSDLHRTPQKTTSSDLGSPVPPGPP